MNATPLIITLAIMLLSACGFTPVYQSGPDAVSTTTHDLMAIDVAVIPDYEEQAVRNHLIDRLYHNGYPSAPQYRLETNKITENIIEIGIDRDDNASRAQLRQETVFRLIDLKTNKPVLTRTVRATTGYNILEGSFTTFVTKEDARTQALRTLADKIIIQLELYFNRTQ